MVLRKIEPKMIRFLDAKLSENGLAQESIRDQDARTLMRLAAQACVGIREIGGNNSGPMVELIQETIGGHSREAWCMSFVQTCIAYAEVKTGRMSPLAVSEGCDYVWSHTLKEYRVSTTPLPGAVVIWGHYDKNGHYSGGHTGIVDYCSEKTFRAFEGNTTAGQDASGRIEREGGGCYYTLRSRRGNGDMIVRGFLKPF